MVKIGDKGEGEKGMKTYHKVINKVFWLIGTSRNAILVILCGVLGFYFFSLGDGEAPFKLIGDIPPGLPSVIPPPFGFTRDNVTVSFFDMVAEMGSGIIVVPLIALLENIAICKAFGKFLLF